MSTDVTARFRADMDEFTQRGEALQQRAADAGRRRILMSLFGALARGPRRLPPHRARARDPPGRLVRTHSVLKELDELAKLVA